MQNTLSNILLAEKIISANATEMFRNLSTRITVGDRNQVTISQEEGDQWRRGWRIAQRCHSDKNVTMLYNNVTLRRLV